MRVPHRESKNKLQQADNKYEETLSSHSNMNVNKPHNFILIIDDKCSEI